MVKPAGLVWTGRAASREPETARRRVPAVAAGVRGPARPDWPDARRTGRAAPRTDDEVRERNAIAIVALDAIEAVEDDTKQRETLESLMRVVDDDRLPDRFMTRPRLTQVES